MLHQLIKVLLFLKTHHLTEQVFNIKNDHEFKKMIDIAFDIQISEQPLYQRFIELTHNISRTYPVTFLPIRFFRSNQILLKNLSPKGFFESSGTTDTINSKHFYHDLEWYEHSFNKTFQLFYGDPKKYVFIALLPSYVERPNSSLVYMASALIKNSNHRYSKFYSLNETASIKEAIRTGEEDGRTIFVLGVTFALLDLAADQMPELKGHIVMETGGMKGRRKEMIREEVHEKLKTGFNVSSIHSEYGMTELFSQAYAVSDGKFKCPPWMKIIISDLHDPFTEVPNGVTGCINVIDLANIHSCPFIATQDLGRTHSDGTFEVLGRMDHSELRGCNLMAF